jgi:hypothetical protein
MFMNFRAIFSVLVLVDIYEVVVLIYILVVDDHYVCLLRRSEVISCCLCFQLNVGRFTCGYLRFVHPGVGV